MPAQRPEEAPGGEVGPRRRLPPEERRALILAAAREAFAAAPYAEASTAGIAREAGSSPALVLHYFGSKAQLYAASVQASLDELAARQADALAALPAGVPARDRVKAVLEAVLDHVAAQPRAWEQPLVGGEEPPEALAVRREARTAQLQALRSLLPVDAGWVRHEYAIAGSLGFLDQACVRWVGAGCPPDQRGPLVEATLGALQGALGDWGA